MSQRIADILGDLEKGHTNIYGLQGSSKALVCAKIAASKQKSPFLVITSTQEHAESFLNDLKFFLSPTEMKRAVIFPESSSLPFTRLSPEPEISADRIHVLYQLMRSSPLIVVAPVTAVMRRVPPKDFISNGTRVIRMKERIDPLELASYLSTYGYEDVGIVEDEGSFARRGGIIDIFPPTLPFPLRIELDDDKIVSMRLFDPATQRSKEDIREVVLIPVRDFPFDEKSRGDACARIKKLAEEKDIPARQWRTVVEATREGIAFSGIETFMPLFHDRSLTILDYLSNDALIIVDEAIDLKAAANGHYEEVLKIANDTESPERIISPDEIIMQYASLENELSKFNLMNWNAFSPENDDGKTAIAAVHSTSDIRSMILGHKSTEDMLSPFALNLKKWQAEGFRLMIVASNVLQSERIKDLLKHHGIKLSSFDAPFETFLELWNASVQIRTGKLSSGFRWPDEKIILITDEEIFGLKISKKVTTQKPFEPFVSFSEIAEGDYIVHEQHGIGKYLGMKHLVIDKIPNDYLLLEYLGGDKLYLPVYRLNLIGRYIGASDDTPFLDKLGGFRFRQLKTKVDASVRTMAKELLAIYAAREVYPGFLFPPPDTQFEEFSAAFPYEETPDQAVAIKDVMHDMGIEKPMDRLVCGDVGYGKTEVAMRAAYRAVLAGKQVAILVPTTILAFQHYESFVRRFKNTAVTIEMLSRFKTAKEQREIIERVSKSQVDIVIGTHRILQKDLRFKDLGLLVIDEEHRFGVRHKEKIKKIKSTVDVMTLTATPIPRTLNLSLTGIRDISVINTPPANRQSIATYVVPFDEGIIRQAILRETARGGQVFFVHNRVETIRSIADRLKRLVPETRFTIAHGQMKEGELEKAMFEFVEKECDVLICTAIIESGLDIPSANTIIIHRADMFGLAQLYQLRGRVGRSNVKAHAYLLTPEGGETTDIAKKRLNVLKRFTELGSGFQIAMHDLEFRGAGNILGSAQSGQIAAVGYEMYAKLLERAVRKLQGKDIEEELDPELTLKVAAFLPDNYVTDPSTRMNLYKKLAGAASEEEIEDISGEMTDRFGNIPAEGLNLLRVMEIKTMAKKLRMKSVVFDGHTLVCQLDKSTPLAPQAILTLSTKADFKCRFAPPDKIIMPLEKEDLNDHLKAIKNSLSKLGCAVN